MEDEKEIEKTPTKGNEWEVVSLTASAYAAAPGPEAFESVDDNHGNEPNKDGDEASRAMFMSGHFVFPPNQHENLPVESTDSEIHVERGSEPVVPNVSGLDMEKGDRSKKTDEDNWTLSGVEVPEEENKLPGHDTEFGAGKELEGLSLVENEQIIDSAHKFSPLFDSSDISGSTVRDEDLTILESNVSTESDLDSSSGPLTPPKKENKSKGFGLPCEAWWKRQAASFYAQAKEANALWSVFVAAALMGLVILGQRWQHERWQTQQLKSQLNLSEEKVSRMMGSLSRFKDVLVGGQRSGSILRGSTSTDR